MPAKKRKQDEEDTDEKENRLMQRLRLLLENISNDDCKLEAFIHYCEKVQTTTSSKLPRWVTGKESFFETLNIVPKDWTENFDFPIDAAEGIAQLLLDQPESFFEAETFQTLKKHIESLLSDCKVTPMRLCNLLSATQKIHDMSSRTNIGEVVASSTINSLLDVICSSFGFIDLNGDKQSTVCLDDELPIIHVRNDGYLYNKEITFLLKEDKALDEVANWHKIGTDCHKLIICMKSLLRENMQKFSFKKEQMAKYSKVMGLSYLQRVVYLFILEATFEEVYDEGEVIIVPKYSIYMQQYSMLPVQMLKLFLDMAYFIQNYVPKDIGSAMKPYKPTSETPFKNKVGLLNLLNTTTEAKITKKKTSKKYKPVVGSVNNNDDIYIVQTTSVIKDVNVEERNIILKLVNRKEYCPHLPHILDIYSNCVEFEKLKSINEKNCKESYILQLARDISIAINYLHTNNIVHRDVKPSNIMVRTFNNANDTSRFVLIDFGVSFEIEEGTNCYYEVRKNTKVIAKTDVGTGLFKPPEVRQELNYNEKIDIYSLGATLLYLKNISVFTSVFENAMDDDVNLYEVMKTIQWDISEFGKTVLEMVNPDPKKRPSASELESLFTSLYLQNAKNADE